MGKKVNFEIPQGTSFTGQWLLSDILNHPINFSGYTVEAELRKEYESTISYPFVASLANSVLTLSMDANTTGALEPVKQVYDVEITDPNGKVTRLMEGIVTITPRVTR